MNYEKLHKKGNTDEKQINFASYFKTDILRVGSISVQK